MKEKNKNLKLYKKYFITCLPLYILMIVITIFFVYNVILYNYLSNEDMAYKTNNIVYADVVEVINNKTDIFAPDRNDWTVSYKYTDGKHEYFGSFIVYGKENVEAYKTNKVAIYIDGNGHSVAVDDYQGDEATQKALITAIICSIVICAFICVAICSFLKQRKKFHISGNQDDT